MFGATAFSSILAFTPPGATSWSSESPELVCAPQPTTPSEFDISYFDETRADGSQVWGVEVAYILSSGDAGDAFLTIDEDGNGEAYLAIDGDIVAHTSLTHDPRTGWPTLTSWSPPDLDHAPELIAESMQIPMGLAINRMFPQEFKCSPFGKQVVKAAKYLWIGATFAAGATCCVTVSATCYLCGVSMALAGEAGAEALDKHCD